MNQVVLVGQVQGGPEIIFDKKDLDRKLMRFFVKIKRPFKNKEGDYEDDIVKIKVWTNNVDISLKDKAVIGIKGCIQSYDIIC